MRDTVNNRSRGFGFVTYSDQDSVDDCLANKPHVVGRCVGCSMFGGGWV